MWRLAVLTPVVALAISAGPSVSASAGLKASDPPTLVPWRGIGDITLGELRTRVESEYGTEGGRYHETGRNGDIISGYYGLHGSQVGVTFQAGRVNELGFTTGYYRTRNGFGVGSSIPLGPCHKTATDPCQHRWHGFVWNAWGRESACMCWVKVGSGAKSLAATTDNFLKPWAFIDVRHGRVTGFYFAWKFVD